MPSMARDFSTFDSTGAPQTIRYKINEQHQFCNFIVTPDNQIDVTIMYVNPSTDTAESMGVEATFTCPANEATPISIPHRIPEIEVSLGMSATGVIEAVRY